MKEERDKAEEKLRRMAKAYVDNLFPDEEYHRQKRLLEMVLESLAVPQANAAEEAGKLIQDLPKLWDGANLEERRKLLLTMLDAVYVDANEEKQVVAIKPKPPFRPVFQVATTKEGSGVMLLNEPLENSPEARACFWWRWGRVELDLKHGMTICLIDFRSVMKQIGMLNAVRAMETTPARTGCRRACLTDIERAMRASAASAR